jgi:hypothetical protein
MDCLVYGAAAVVVAVLVYAAIGKILEPIAAKIVELWVEKGFW